MVDLSKNLMSVDIFTELDPKIDQISEKILYWLLNISDAHIDVLKIFQHNL